MASNGGLVMTGLTELRAALRALPHELKAEASHIVEGTANSAAFAIRAKYPARTGRLRAGVEVRHLAAGTFGSGALVVQRNPLGWIFENGTQARHNRLGANRGSMPPGHVFLPIAIQKRREMYTELKALLVRHGLLVSGDA